MFPLAIYLYYAFGLQNLLNHIKQKLLFKFWNFRMWMKYVWSIVSIELFAGRGHFVNNRFSSIIGDVMTNSWSRAVAIFAIFHFSYILLQFSCELPRQSINFVWLPAFDQFPSPYTPHVLLDTESRTPTFWRAISAQQNDKHICFTTFTF